MTTVETWEGVVLIQPPLPVPYYAQLASPGLAAAVFDDGLDPSLDPHWAESGFTRLEDYAYWAPRACGIACLQMVCEAFGGPRRKMSEWIGLGLALDGYIIGSCISGQPEERGWDHRALAGLLEQAGIRAEAAPAALAQIGDALRSSQLVIASVSYELGKPGPVCRRGGHLVVVTGALERRNGLEALVINNPSGRTPELRQGARIPAIRFEQAYAGRAIIAGPRLAP